MKVTNIINPEVKNILTEHFAERIQFFPSEQANESLFYTFLCSLDTTKNVTEKLQKSFLEIDFDLNYTFCDGEDLLGSWNNSPLSDKI